MIGAGRRPEPLERRARTPAQAARARRDPRRAARRSPARASRSTRVRTDSRAARPAAGIPPSGARQVEAGAAAERDGAAASESPRTRAPARSAPSAGARRPPPRAGSPAPRAPRRQPSRRTRGDRPLGCTPAPPRRRRATRRRAARDRSATDPAPRGRPPAPGHRSHRHLRRDRLVADVDADERVIQVGEEREARFATRRRPAPGPRRDRRSRRRARRAARAPRAPGRRDRSAPPSSERSPARGPDRRARRAGGSSEQRAGVVGAALASSGAVGSTRATYGARSRAPPRVGGDEQVARRRQARGRRSGWAAAHGRPAPRRALELHAYRATTTTVAGIARPGAEQRRTRATSFTGKASAHCGGAIASPGEPSVTGPPPPRSRAAPRRPPGR